MIVVILLKCHFGNHWGATFRLKTGEQPAQKNEGENKTEEQDVTPSDSTKPVVGGCNLSDNADIWLPSGYQTQEAKDREFYREDSASPTTVDGVSGSKISAVDAMY